MSLFDRQKERSLQALRGGPDKSRKGVVDEEVRSLLAAINSREEFFTTSSCAGRITLFVEPASGRKCEGSWLFVSHQPIASRDVLAALARLPRETVWFKAEGAILHVCCRSLEEADAFLKACKEAGWKHSGVTGTSPKIMVEAMTSERIEVPIASNGSLFVPEGFLRYLVREANRKLSRTREKMDRLEALLASPERVTRRGRSS